VNVETGLGADQVWVGHFPGQNNVVAQLDAGIGAFLELEVPQLPVDAGAVGVGRHLTIDTGDDDDVVAISDVLVERNATIETGEGDDQVFLLAMSDLEDEVELATLLPVPLESNPDRGLEVGGKLSIKLGDGSDALTAMNTSAEKGIRIHDPQTDTEFVFANLDGGRHGIVINGPGHGGGNGPFGGLFRRLNDFFDDLFNRFNNGVGGFGGFFR
jgi:hypothetical protein